MNKKEKLPVIIGENVEFVQKPENPRIDKALVKTVKKVFTDFIYPKAEPTIFARGKKLNCWLRFRFHNYQQYKLGVFKCQLCGYKKDYRGGHGY